jgi:hypothetical protein
LQNRVLLDRLVAEKLEHEAAAIRSQEWKWVEVSADLWRMAYEMAPATKVGGGC